MIWYSRDVKLTRSATAGWWQIEHEIETIE